MDLTTYFLGWFQQAQSKILFRSIDFVEKWQLLIINPEGVARCNPRTRFGFSSLNQLQFTGVSPVALLNAGLLRKSPSSSSWERKGSLCCRRTCHLKLSHSKDTQRGSHSLDTFLPSFLLSRPPFLPSFFPSFFSSLPSFLLSHLPFLLPFFLPSLPSLLSSFLPSFPPPFLPSLLPSFPSSFNSSIASLPSSYPPFLPSFLPSFSPPLPPSLPPSLPSFECCLVQAKLDGA